MKKSFDFDDGCCAGSCQADAQHYSHAAWQKRIIDRIARDAVYERRANLEDVDAARFCVRGPVREDDTMASADEVHVDV